MTELTAQQRFDARRRLERAGIPKAYLAAGIDLGTLDVDGRETALAAAREFGASERAGLLLTGGVGVGKSTIAAAAAKRYIVHHGSLRWVDVVDLCLRLTTNGPLRAEAFERLVDHDGALVLDDLDKARPSAFAAEVVLSAVSNAVGNLRPLIVTTNLPVSSLAEHWPEPFGEAIASRLVGYCTICAVTGHDRREPA